MSRISILKVPSSLGRHRQNDMESEPRALLELDLAAQLQATEIGAVPATAGNATALINLMPAEHRMPDGLSCARPCAVHRIVGTAGAAFDGAGLAPTDDVARGPADLLLDGSPVGADDIGTRS